MKTKRKYSTIDRVILGLFVTVYFLLPIAAIFAPQVAGTTVVGFLFGALYIHNNFED